MNAILIILGIAFAFWFFRNPKMQIPAFFFCLPFDGIKYGGKHFNMTFSLRRKFVASAVELNSGITSMLSLGNFVLILLLISFFINQQRDRPISVGQRVKLINLPLLFLVGCGFVGVLVSEDSAFSFRRFVTMVATYTTFYIAVALIDDRQKLRLAVRAIIAGGIVASVWALCQGLVYKLWGVQFGAMELFVGGKELFFPRVNGPFLDPTYLGVYCLTAIFLVLDEINRAQSRNYKFMLGGIIVLLFAATIVTFSRSAWVGGLFGFFLYQFRLVATEKRSSVVNIIAFSVICVFCIAVATNFEKLIEMSPKTVEYRRTLYSNAIALVWKSPLVGHGIGSDRMLLSSVTHNTYISYAVGQGLVGLAAFCLLICTVLRTASKLNLTPVLKSTNSCLLAIFASMLVAFLTYDLQGLRVFWAVGGMLIAVYWIAIEEFHSQSDQGVPWITNR